MDCSWLVEDNCSEEQGSESDPEEESQAELEARLYAIVHHSDLSQPLSPELAKHYSIQCGEDGKLTVALNDSLENIKSEEVKKLGHLIKDSEPDNESSDVVEIESESAPVRDDILSISNNLLNTNESFSKKYRYSNINLDSDVTVEANVFNESSDINYSDLNYFKVTPSFFNKKNAKKLKNLVIPPSFQTSDSPDWKDSANESFISIGTDTSAGEADIIDQMVFALKKVNPKEKRGKLYFLAKALFFHNRRKYRQLLRRKQTKANVNRAFESSLEGDKKLVSNKSEEPTAKLSVMKNNKNIFEGSVSLNISPFKPLSPTVDLVSEDENDNLSETITTENTKKWKSLPECETPKKWTKKMIKFYTKPSRRKMKTDLNDIFESLKRNTTVDDWRVDPRDEKGVYQGTPLKGKYRNRRCPNCNRFGHIMHECPSPRKIPSCFFCGLNYHTAHSCPNKICFKCGVYVTNEAYECSTCYYNTFNYDTPCGVCGQFFHRTEICPDLWRSFHATVDGDKKIPKKVMENKRKYCCNCASKGHFSHQCPFPSAEGEHISAFVTNYSASQCENGTTEIAVPHSYSHIIENTDADRFLQNLSNSTNTVIDFEEGEADFVFRVSGTFEQCRKVRREIEEYVNTRKRKRQEPYPKRKRRRIR